ncbi:MAG: HPr family phosphocarrier protein [Planctomycetia bacterium]|nr:HPr family phosphocarrier protein [Planctomycetia bacterium]
MKISKKLTVKNKAGFHLRVASMICKKTASFNGEVCLIKGPYRADCKSCLDLLAIMAPMGVELTLEVDGSDENETNSLVNAITEMFNTKFGEDEFAPNAASAS